MFSIYADGNCVYNDVYPLESYKVSSPRLKMADSAAGSLEMVLPPTNACYETLRRMKSTIIVKRYEEEIWEGRIVEDSYNFYNERSVYCEGALAYLNDTCQPQREYTNVTLDIFLQSIFDIHNSKVADNRKIYYDYQSVTGEFIERITTQYQKTLEVLNEVCTNYSCHMKLVRRRVNIGTEEKPVYETRKFVQFFKGPSGTTAQVVEFGKNLLDYTADFNMSELATVILPLGATKNRANSSGVGPAIDLTVSDPNGAYNPDIGYQVVKGINDNAPGLSTTYTCLNFEDQIKDTSTANPKIIAVDDGISYVTAILKVKASTLFTNEDGSTVDTKNTIFLTSRMHGGRGMYFWYTPNFNPITQPTGGSFVSGKWSSVPVGFTDSIEEAIDVPYITDSSSQDIKSAGYYILYVGSFGGDIQLRVNQKATVSDEMDEYYTAEDALVSTVNLLGSMPTLENGRISVSENSIGQNADASEDNDKYIRTQGWIHDSNNTFFEGGNYSVTVKTTSGNVVQARVFHRSGHSPAYYDDWKNVPYRFRIPDGENVEELRFAFRYAGTNATFDPGDITEMTLVSGEKYGSLYVTAQSRNLFNDTLERGSIIDSGDLVGQVSSETTLTSLRSSTLLGMTVSGGDITGFTEGDYLISGEMVKDSPTDSRTIECQIFHYSADGDYVSLDNWDPIPRQFSILEGEKLRFTFRYSDSSSINVSGLLNVMLEQGVITPSMYEPANTSMEEYGWIEKCITWDDVESSDELYYRAKTYLASGQFDHMTLDVTALDLGALGVNADSLEINDYIRVISPPHGLDKFFEITELDIPLAEPENMTYKLGGETEQTLTGINNNLNNDLLKMIEGDINGSSILKSAKTEASKVIMDGFTNSYMVTLLDDDDHPAGLGFFKVPITDPTTGELDYVGYNDIPDAHLSSIINNEKYRNVMCLFINTAGIVFYGNGMCADPTIALVNSKGQIVADSIVTGTMLADRIRGGTMWLGYWPVEGPGGAVTYTEGELVVLNNQYDSTIGDNEWSNRVVEIVKDSNTGKFYLSQQGRSDDGIYRQVRIENGTLSGSLYWESTHANPGWNTGGEILLCTNWGSDYGMEIRSLHGPLVFNATSIGVMTSGSAIAGGYNSPVTVSDGNGGTITLHFTHGLLTGIT